MDRTVRLQVEISPDEDFRRLIYRQDAVADAARDFTVHHRADHRVLQPGEQYFYRFVTCDDSSPVGRFRTARPADSREPVRIGFFSCQRYPRGYFTPHAALLERGRRPHRLARRLHLRDRRARSAIPTARTAPAPTATARCRRSTSTATSTRSTTPTPNLQALRAKHPMLAIWDDHEFENNYAGDGPSPNPEERTVSRRRVSFQERQGAAYAAFFEHLPVLRTADFPRIYGSIPMGGNAECSCSTRASTATSSRAAT